MAAGLLPLQGKSGIPGWGWIFLVEGVVGVFMWVRQVEHRR